MATKQIPLAEATPAQLRDFAEIHLGIPDVPANAGAAKIKALISPVWTKDYIEVEASAAEPRIERRLAPTNGLRPGFDEILIQKTEEPGGDRPVYVAVNGNGMLIERGKPQIVKKEYVESLQNAIKFVYHQDDDLQLHRREVPTYPFSVLRTGPLTADQEAKIATREELIASAA